MGRKNRITIEGNLGDDAVTRDAGNGSKVTNLRVATNEPWTDKDGNKHENTEWHNVACWNGLTKLASKLKKGTMVIVEGSMTYKDGPEGSKGAKYATIKAITVRVVDVSYFDRK